jgi:hypothetical protein
MITPEQIAETAMAIAKAQNNPYVDRITGYAGEDYIGDPALYIELYLKPGKEVTWNNVKDFSIYQDELERKLSSAFEERTPYVRIFEQKQKAKIGA